MLRYYFDGGGPVMYLVLLAWVVVFAGILDRLLYLLSAMYRRPLRGLRRLAKTCGGSAAREHWLRERNAASRSLARIDAVSQLATSLGLFGTVLGIARAFFARGGELGLAAPEVLASGLATALFTTIAGLVVFLVGQGFLIFWDDMQRAWDRRVEHVLEEDRR